MIPDLATTELKAKLCIDGSVESFSSYNGKHTRKVERKHGRADAIAHLQELTLRGRVALTCHPVLRKLRQGDYSKFKDSLNSRMRPCPKRHMYVPVSPPKTHTHLKHTCPQKSPLPILLTTKLCRGKYKQINSENKQDQI